MINIFNDIAYVCFKSGSSRITSVRVDLIDNCNILSSNLIYDNPDIPIFGFIIG